MAKGKATEDESAMLIHYRALGRFNEAKGKLLDRWLMDKSCKWWNEYKSSMVTTDATTTHNVSGFGTIYDLAKLINMDYANEAQKVIVDSIAAECPSDDDWDAKNAILVAVVVMVVFVVVVMVVVVVVVMVGGGGGGHPCQAIERGYKAAGLKRFKLDKDLMMTHDVSVAEREETTTSAEYRTQLPMVVVMVVVVDDGGGGAWVAMVVMVMAIPIVGVVGVGCGDGDGDDNDRGDGRDRRW